MLLVNDDNRELAKDLENTTIVESEEDLLKYIVRYVKDSDPDVLSGWNSNGFDLPYLIRRMQQYNIDVNELSPMNQVYFSKYSEEPVIKGIILLDFMVAYKQFRRLSNQGNAESYSLEFTAQSVLGTGKIKHTENFHDFWVNNPVDFIKYNKRDVELCLRIDEELEIIDFFNSIRAKANSQLLDIYKTSVLVDGLLLRFVRNNYVLPSRNKGGGEQYAGAHVFNPEPGVFKNVITLDLKSMYPNIIKTFNMGYDTFNKDGDIKINENIGFNSGTGLFSSVLSNLEKERALYKKKMKTSKDKREWRSEERRVGKECRSRWSPYH